MIFIRCYHLVSSFVFINFFKMDTKLSSIETRALKAKNESTKITPPPRSGVSPILPFIRHGPPIIPLPFPTLLAQW